MRECGNVKMKAPGLGFIPSREGRTEDSLNSKKSGWVDEQRTEP